MKTENSTPTPLDLAKRYLESGYTPIPVVAGGKRPVHAGWQNKKFDTAVDLKALFQSNNNIGILLGTASAGLTDVDIDDAAAIEIAHHFLPSTGKIFGRKSSPNSHWLYHVRDCETRTAFVGPQGMLVEVRANNHQTVFPGSVHETGERIEFSSDDQPSDQSWATIKRSAGKLAMATLLLPLWIKGKRHDLSLAISAVLARSGWSCEDALDFVKKLCAAAGDSDDRDQAVRDTFRRFGSSEPITSITRCEDAVTKPVYLSLRGILKQISPARTHNASESVPERNTDVDCAYAFASEQEGEVLHCPASKEWFKRTGQLYQLTYPVEIQGRAKDFAKRMADHPMFRNPAEARKMLTKSRVNAMVELSRTQFLIDRKDMDCALELVGTKDGRIFDLQRQQHDDVSNAVITKHIGCKFDPSATAPQWEAFLDRIFPGQSDIIAFLQRAVGYSLTGDTGEQCLFMLTGSGANGKSTFLVTMNSLFGDYGGTTPMDTLMVRKNNSATNDLAELFGKRFVSASEGEVGQRLAESKIKSMTGGDPISCRKLYENLFEYMPQFKLWIATNALPDVQGTDEAIWRRIRLIDFPVTIPVEERDPKLVRKLRAELPGIFNWALEGLRAWQQKGLCPPDAVIKSTSDYRANNDTVGQFLSDCCRLDAQYKSTTKELYDAYKRWAEQSGVQPMANNLFGKALGQRGLRPFKARTGNGWCGVAIVP